MTLMPAPPVGRSVTVKVPATSANLGPGFDTLGLALSLYDDLEVRVREQPGASVEVRGIGEGEVPTDETNLVVRSIRFVFDRYGVEFPGLELVASNLIPHGRGLGSSGAAIVSGIMAAKGLLEGIIELDSNALLSLASELEGHPDNVAPALFGGLTIAWSGEHGPQHKKLMVHRGVSPLVCVPDYTLSTELARSLRPVSVPHEDAIFNVSRSALLIAALIQSPELLHDATEDRLHQNYRASAMPETVALVEELRGHGHAAVVSGAGPSVLVLCSDPAERLVAADLVAAHDGSPWQALMLAVDFKGATVNLHPAKSLA
ncbi:homoserine kinase [Salinibacterium sp. SYSU T00001]|uniref:homoserine kinase n=1 Tax=Homoserinimonas sedimenticola TaxID=2986805 RepID=UPI0022364E86|nr:homoserine kinase [Salinibacterium sedimenticola]MCW4386655.1 homoserine kinase [Salinibacterium sedimenticola]